VEAVIRASHNGNIQINCEEIMVGNIKSDSPIKDLNFAQPSVTAEKRAAVLVDFLKALANLVELADGNAPSKKTTERQIKQGDTLSSLAQELKTSVGELLKLNPQIKNPDLILAGKTLNVPGKSGSQADTSANTSSISGSESSADKSNSAINSKSTGTSPTSESDSKSSVREDGNAKQNFKSNGGLDLNGVIGRSNALAQEIKAQTGQDMIVTSGRRPADRQAAAMANNYANGTSPGYANQSAEAEVKQAWRNGGVPAMTRVLEAQMARGVFISNHMKADSIDVGKNVSLSALQNSPLVKHVGVEGNHFHVDLKTSA
jgi:LysM repeat protein